MKRMMVLLCASLTPAFLACPPAAHGWGCRGHEAIAALAEKHLTPEARQALFALLTANPIDPQLKRYCGQRNLDPFVDASTWADDERGVEPATAPWHFIDVPLSETNDNSPLRSFCGPGGCVIQAIAEQLAILKDKTVPAAKRATALRYVIHFVGDLHQPLHATDNSDRGGNCVPVKYFRRKPRVHNNNYTPNLHHIWDTEIPEGRMQGADGAEFADYLDEQFANFIGEWQQGGMQLEKWAWESHQQAVHVTYGALGTPVAKEAAGPVNGCADDNNIGQRMLRKHIVIGTAYEERAGAVVEQRLAQAGIRLAMILNDATKNGF